MAKILRRLLSHSMAVLLAVQTILATSLPARAQGLNLIRDSEIEGLMRAYTAPIFKAAGINAGSVRVYLIADPSINAFVAGGQRIFINTGLLMQSKSPNQVIGVLAHETGHIAGGHLARMGKEMDKMSTAAIVGMLLGAAAAVGGAAAGSGEATRAGGGVMMGTTGMLQRSMLSYQRAQESAADQAAIKFLDATQQSGKGMLDLFQLLASQSLGSLQYANPYTMSHPMPLDRIRDLERAVEKSPYYNKPDSPDLVLRHQLMQAKLVGFTESPQIVYQRYPSSNGSLPARYARAIASYRTGNLKNALPLIDDLIASQPANPWFWELKGQALLEGGRGREAVEPLQRAVKLAPQAGLIQIMLAQALLDGGNAQSADVALTALKLAQRTESDTVQLWRFMALAYGQLGDIPRAELCTADAALRAGDRELAVTKAKAVMNKFERGSPEWIRAQDILNFSKVKG